MKTLKKLKTLLVALIGITSLNAAHAQCSSSFTALDNGNGNYTFNNTSTGSGTNYLWNFGDGTNSNATNPSHTFTANGAYVIQLEVYHPLDSSCYAYTVDTINVTDLVNPCNGINLGFTPANNGAGNYSFTNTSTGNSDYFWDFGDGSSTNTTNAQHQYSANGTYNICLSMDTNNTACTICDTIIVSDAPPCNTNASFTYTDNGTGSYTFNTTSSGNYPLMNWDFGDGNGAFSDHPTHTYSANGTYIVCLNIDTNITACINTFCDTIIVTNIPPCITSASFTYTNNGNGSYTFNNTSTGNNPLMNWGFGDGNLAYSDHPTHTYSTNGTYIVCLNLGSNYNACRSICDTIIVTGVINSTPCQAAFMVTPDSTNLGNVLVINSSTGNNLTYFWEFGDGNTSSLAFPNYTYSATGPFFLCLTVDDGDGCTSTHCDSIDSGGLVLKQGGFSIEVEPPTVTGIDNKIELISALRTYPNPVKNKLTLEINLTEPTQIEVSASNVVGTFMATIVNQEMNSGLNKIKWDTNNLPNGLYLVYIKSNNSIQVKKIVINK